MLEIKIRPPKNNFMRRLLVALMIAGLAQSSAPAQDAVTIRVDAAKKVSPFKPIYAYFGYDEPNYTYTANGKKLVGELAALTDTSVYVRTHFMLATGDGTAGLKWGSTNAYTEDAVGKAVYDWTIADRIFDTYLQNRRKAICGDWVYAAGAVEQARAVPADWIPVQKIRIMRRVGVIHRTITRNGENWFTNGRGIVRRNTAKQKLNCGIGKLWNEPDISYWHGTQEEYNKLYDYATAGVKRALAERTGGRSGDNGASE